MLLCLDLNVFRYRRPKFMLESSHNHYWCPRGIDLLHSSSVHNNYLHDLHVEIQA